MTTTAQDIVTALTAGEFTANDIDRILDAAQAARKQATRKAIADNEGKDLGPITAGCTARVFLPEGYRPLYLSGALVKVDRLMQTNAGCTVISGPNNPPSGKKFRLPIADLTKVAD